MEKQLDSLAFLKEKLFNESLFSMSKEKLCTLILQVFLISEGHAEIVKCNDQYVVFIEEGYEFSESFLQLSAKLGIKPSKLENIINQIRLQSIFECHNEKEYVAKIIFNKEEVIEIRKNTDSSLYLALFVRDKIAREVIERTLKRYNKPYDYSFNKDFLLLSQAGFKVIMNEFLSEEDFKDLAERVKDKIISETKEEIISEIVDTFFEKLLGQASIRVVKKLIDLIRISLSEN